MALEINREIRRAVDTGKAVMGKKVSEKSILKDKGQLIIISRNLPKLAGERFRHYSELSKTPLYVFDGTGIELGAICGKPFVVSVMLVIDSGKSKLLEAVKSGEGKAVKSSERK